MPPRPEPASSPGTGPAPRSETASRRPARDPLRILVALDGSDPSRVALELVACLPLTAADLVIVMSAAELSPTTARRLRRRQGEDLDVLLRAAWASERDAARRTVDDAGGALGSWETPVRQVVRSGPVVEAIERASRELRADLLVVGARGRGALTRLLVGSVAQALPGRVACPVVVARPPVGAPVRVVLAVDGSPHGLEAARRLAAYPLATEVCVTVVSVASAAGSRGRSAAGVHAAAAAEVLEAAGRTAGVVVRSGNPAREIVALAGAVGTDLVAVGSRGLGGARGLLLGSVSQHVVAHAPCSVLVAPPARPRRRSTPEGPGDPPNHPRG